MWAAGPLEQALGLLATLMLRNPAAAELAADSGCIDSCVEVMQACERDNFSDSATGTQWVLRQVSFSHLEASYRGDQHAAAQASERDFNDCHECNMLHCPGMLLQQHVHIARATEQELDG